MLAPCLAAEAMLPRTDRRRPNQTPEIQITTLAEREPQAAPHAIAIPASMDQTIHIKESRLQRVFTHTAPWEAA